MIGSQLVAIGSWLVIAASTAGIVLGGGGAGGGRGGGGVVVAVVAPRDRQHLAVAEITGGSVSAAGGSVAAQRVYRAVDEEGNR